MKTIHLYNTLTGEKQPFTPLNCGKPGMYVCGPTVYGRPHLGNARSVVVYDALFRLLRHAYGEENVTYVRNITDVDDKIIDRAKERGIAIDALTQEVTAQFHEDMTQLGCLPPTVEPRATQYISQMTDMIGRLIENGNAYVSAGHVLFDVTSASANAAWKYGMLSGRKLDELQAGARIAVEGYKRNSGDFVLWKPAAEGDDLSSVFDSPWGKGRPGWHIECSAMSTDLLGETFDIHGGGADLKFPHHENEIAQSCCANPQGEFAKLWVHNGFLTVDGEKMSKSLGNFTTVQDVLSRGIKGEVIRYALLMARYNEPLDWNEKLVGDAQKSLDYLYRCIGAANLLRGEEKAEENKANWRDVQILDSLLDDLNIPLYFSKLRKLAELATKQFADHPEVADEYAYIVFKHAQIMGFLQGNPSAWFKGEGGNDVAIEARIAERQEAKRAKDFARADAIRAALLADGIVLEDKPGGVTEWRRA